MFVCKRPDKAQFKIFNNAVPFADAQQTCKKWGGNLASIENAGVQARLVGATMDLTSNYWLGMEKTETSW